MLLCTEQGSRAQCECTPTQLLLVPVSYSKDATLPTGITVPHRCWRPCASGWSPSGWKAVRWALAWAETVPSECAEQSPFSCPSDVPGLNKSNKLGHLDASRTNTQHVNMVQPCFANKQRTVWFHNCLSLEHSAQWQSRAERNDTLARQSLSTSYSGSLERASSCCAWSSSWDTYTHSHTRDAVV